MLAPAAVLLATWILFQIGIAFGEGGRGWMVLAWSSISPLVAISILVALTAVVEASALGARGRTFAMVSAAIAAGAVANVIDRAMAIALGGGAGPGWTHPAVWWVNFGWTTVFFTGTVLAYDYRVRSTRRAAALRKARLQAAGVIRRTAEVRLQAMQARIDPRFLFDALAAVERIHDVDAAAGDHLLDNLIKYLRAVLPDLLATQSTVGKEVELARVWLAIRDPIVGAIGIHTIEATGDVDSRPFPAMTLIPLVEAVLSETSASATITMRAQCEGALARVRIECRSPCAAEPPSVQPLRARLTELYGEQVRLEFTCDAVRGRQAAVEVRL